MSNIIQFPSNFNAATMREHPFMDAEAVKRRYESKLDKLMAKYQRKLADALRDPSLSPEYQAAELAGYTYRLSRRAVEHAKAANARAARLEAKTRTKQKFELRPSRKQLLRWMVRSMPTSGS